MKTRNGSTLRNPERKMKDFLCYFEATARREARLCVDSWSSGWTCASERVWVSGNVRIDEETVLGHQMTLFHICIFIPILFLYCVYYRPRS